MTLKRGRPALYPWDDIEVGQSITVQRKSAKPALGSAIQWAASRRNGAKFTSRVQSSGMVQITRLQDQPVGAVRKADDGLFRAPVMEVGADAQAPLKSRYGFETMDIGETIIFDARSAGRVRAAWDRFSANLPDVRFEGERQGKLFAFTRTA